MAYSENSNLEWSDLSRSLIFCVASKPLRMGILKQDYLVVKNGRKAYWISINTASKDLSDETVSRPSCPFVVFTTV